MRTEKDLCIEMLRPEQVPRFGRFLEEMEPEGVEGLHRSDFIAVGALDADEPVGLGYARIFRDRPGTDRPYATIYGIVAADSFRGIKLESLMFELIDETLRNLGCDEAFFNFINDTSGFQQICLTLEKSGWDRPVIDCWEYHLSVPKAFAEIRWLQRAERRRRGESIFLWKDITSEERKQLKNEGDKNSWKADGVSPFFKGLVYDPNTSVGLRMNGNVHGWLIMESPGPGRNHASSYWVRKEFRGGINTIQLLGASLIQMKKNDIQELTYSVKTKNQSVVSFYESAVGPAITRKVEYWYSKKIFD